MSTDQANQAAATAGGGEGPLARLLETRGGTAAPEAPFVIEHREALIYMLCEAAELEHGIMCQYLFAAFSLKESEDEGLTPDELAAVTRWQRQILSVAAGEMLHLALVHNLLSAIGMAPHLSRPNLPAPAGHYPAGVQLALLPFGDQALRHFMYLERPEGMDLQDAEGLAAMQTATPSVSPRDIVPTPQDFATVGHLYRSIEAGFAAPDREVRGGLAVHRAAPRAGHPGAVRLARTSCRSPGWTAPARRSRKSWSRARAREGTGRDAHFGQFVAILDEYEQMREANPGFETGRRWPRTSARTTGACAVPVITDPLTARVTDLFNVNYEILLQLFGRFFAHTSETDAQLKVLADASVELMVQVIKPLGSLITTLPPGPAYPGRTAGPSFELFYESDYLMPHQHAAWALLVERLDAGGLVVQRTVRLARHGRRGPAGTGARRHPPDCRITGRAPGLPAPRRPSWRRPGRRWPAADIDALAMAVTRILDGMPAGAQTPAETTRAAGELLSAARNLPGPGGRRAAGDPEAAAAAGRLREAVLAATRLRAWPRPIRHLPPRAHRSGRGPAGRAAPGRAPQPGTGVARRSPAGAVCPCQPRSRPPATAPTWSRTCPRC